MELIQNINFLLGAVHQDFKAINIHPVKDDEDGDVVRCEALDPETEAYSVYYETADGLEYWISDHPTEDEAQQFKMLLMSIGRHYNVDIDNAFMPLNKWCIHGTDVCQEYDVKGLEPAKVLASDNIHGQVIHRQFRTQGELDAYVQGMEDVDGYGEFSIPVDITDLNNGYSQNKADAIRSCGHNPLDCINPNYVEQYKEVYILDLNDDSDYLHTEEHEPLRNYKEAGDCAFFEDGKL